MTDPMPCHHVLCPPATPPSLWAEDQLKWLDFNCLTLTATFQSAASSAQYLKTGWTGDCNSSDCQQQFWDQVSHCHNQKDPKLSLAGLKFPSLQVHPNYTNPGWQKIESTRGQRLWFAKQNLQNQQPVGNIQSQAPSWWFPLSRLRSSAAALAAEPRWMSEARPCYGLARHTKFRSFRGMNSPACWSSHPDLPCYKIFSRQPKSRNQTYALPCCSF